MKTVIVPFQIKCLHLTQSLTVAEASADFSDIPYFDKKRGITVNAENPYLSENILSQPFQNQNLELPAGVHLHFNLPKRLTTTIKTLDENGKTDKKYPAVPNRWLIYKTKDGEATQKWVLESDYLWAEDAPTTETQGKITIPLPVDDIKASAEFSKPFRYMGKLYNLEDWMSNGEQGEYWTDFFESSLTALGYGNETFSGYMPNCNGVFSFLDDGENAALEAKVKYEVWGWYSDSTTGAALADFYQNTADFEDISRLGAFQSEFGWTIENSTSEDLPQQFLLYSSVELSKTSHEDKLKNENTDIALGNRGTEALSAYLANAIDSDNKAKVEDQIEAIQIDVLQNKKVDVYQKFVEARHTKGFNAKTGGVLWAYDLMSDSDTDLSNAEFSKDIQQILSDPDVDEQMYDAALILAQLNFLQYQIDRGHRLIHSKRHQLFADWYKYMLAAHPPVGQEKQYPKADEVLQFINRYVIRDIYEQMQRVGSLERHQEEEEDDDFEDDFWFTTKDYDSLADQFVEMFEELQRQLRSVNQAIRFQRRERNTEKAIANGKPEFRFPALTNINVGFRIVSKPAPRYYEANEPVVLLSGEVTRPTAEPQSQNIKCYEVDWDVTDMKTLIPTFFKGIITVPFAEMTHTVRDLMRPRAITQQDWNPTLLEWEISYIPVDDPADDPLGYELDFIKNNFDLPENTPEYALKKAEKEVFSRKIRQYRGSTILTDYAQKAIGKKLKDYIDRHHLTDENNTLVKAYNHLQEISAVSQSLGGFNQALIMRKQTLQLEIDDPISLPNYEPLIDSIREFIGDSVKSAPDPSNYFNPIRAGGMNIVRLRIIDSFGRTIEVFNSDNGDKATIANTFTPPPTLSSHFHAMLMPRFVQPARLNLRWIAAEDDTVDSTAHAATSPICGWIIPNFLEETISIFNKEGELLGSLGNYESHDEDIYLIPKPGSENFTTADIENIHLKNFVGYLYYNGKQFLDDFLGELRDSLEFVDPENFAQHSSLSMLTGRPLAIVRASLSLELMEDYALNQDWNIFRKDLVNATNRKHKRATYDFEKVKIPFRLGDANQLNDGIIGFWKDGENKSSIDYEDKLYMPSAKKEGDTADYQETSEYIVTPGEGDFLMYQSLADARQLLTILFDPRAQLNVATGVLPVKTIDIPEVHWKKALDNMNVQFLVAPILTLKDSFQMPTSIETGYQWHWTYLQNNKLKEIPSQPTIDRFIMEQAYDRAGGDEKYYLWGTLIESNWISTLKEDVTKGYINYDLATREDLPKPYDESLINRLLNQLYQSISGVVTDAQFGQMELREGWLKLVKVEKVTRVDDF